MEALHGQLWDNDDDISHRVYGVLRKVEPMNRAIAELGGEALLSGGTILLLLLLLPRPLSPSPLPLATQSVADRRTTGRPWSG